MGLELKQEAEAACLSRTRGLPAPLTRTLTLLPPAREGAGLLLRVGTHLFTRPPGEGPLANGSTAHTSR